MMVLRLLEALESLAVENGEILCIAGRRITIGDFWYNLSYVSWEEGLFGAYTRGTAHYLLKREKWEGASKALKVAKEALRNYHHCEITESGKGPCDGCAALDEIDRIVKEEQS